MKESKTIKENACAMFGVTGFLLILTVVFWLLKGWFVAISLVFLALSVWSFIQAARLAKTIRYWRWLESGESVPANLKQKYLLYEAALRNVEGYRKDVARMETRAQSIRAEIEAEMKK